MAVQTVASVGSVLASATAGAFQQVAQLLGALPGEFEAGAASEGGVVLLANFLPGTGPSARPIPARSLHVLRLPDDFAIRRNGFGDRPLTR